MQAICFFSVCSVDKTTETTLAYGLSIRILWTWRKKSHFHFSTVHGRFQDCFSRLRGMPNCGHCADASARKASATK